MKNYININKGFTLIEALIILAIIAILVAVVIVAFNPTAQFDKNNDSKRAEDVSAISEAIARYRADNKGAVPSVITTRDAEICETGAPSCSGLVNLFVLTNNGAYLPEIPKDPECDSVCAPNGTGYFVRRELDGRVTVSAPHRVLASVSITR